MYFDWLYKVKARKNVHKSSYLVSKFISHKDID